MALTGLAPQSAEAREDVRHQVDLRASTLSHALAELARQTGVSIGAQGDLPKRPTPPVHGRITVADALDRLLSGSGLAAHQVGPTAWRIEQRKPAASPPRRQPLTATLAPAPQAPPVEIVVTASKRAQDLADVPMSLSVVSLSPDEVDPSQDTESIAEAVEGLALTGEGAGRNRLSLRGISDSAFTGESQATVAVVLDNARLTYSAPDPDIRLVDMKRVEVIKGPQGSLYGTGALGGIYHLVANQPLLDRTEFTGTASGTALTTGDGGYALSAMANIPVVENALGIRLVGYTATEPGWVDTGARRNSNSMRVSGVRAGAGVALESGWAINLTGFAQWLESRDSSYVYLPHRRSRPRQLPEPHDNDLRHLAMRIENPSGPVGIAISTAITKHEVGDVLDATSGANSFGLADPQLLRQDRNYRVMDNEVRLHGVVGNLKWLGGISWLEARQHLVTELQGPATSSILDDDGRDTTDLAAFGDLTVPVSGDISLDAGVRLFRSKTTEERSFPTGIYRFRSTRSGLTPSIALSCKCSERQLLWLRYGSAIRQGGSEIGENGAAERLKGDELGMIEAGWRVGRPNGARFELAAWYGWWENLQSDLLQPNGLIETENAGNGVIWGVEGSLIAPLGEHWMAEAGGNFTMAKLTRNTLGYELQDSHLPGVPEYTLRGAIQRKFELGWGDSSVRLALRYVGPSRLSFDPAIDRPMGKLLESSFEWKLALDTATLTFRIENLLGRKDDTFAFGNSLRFSTSRQFTPQPPTRISLNLVTRF